MVHCSPNRLIQGTLDRLVVAALLFFVALSAHGLPAGVEEVLDLPPGEGNPRNSEGAFLALKENKLLFIYTHFTGGAGDHATAHLAQRISTDGGRTWSEEETALFAGEAEQNVMSVSLLRLDADRIAIFYLQKNSIQHCMPVMRISEDEAQTWGPPREIVDRPGYYVLNNDRVVQLASGRLLAPLALHTPGDGEWTANAELVIAMSDDLGTQWRLGKDKIRVGEDHGANPLQEPGVVETGADEVLLFIRTGGGRQYFARSEDGGETWGEIFPSPMASPRSPASIKPHPKSGALVGLWNDHETIAPTSPDWRTPLVLGISEDQGATWPRRLVLEDDPEGWYCYTAMHWSDDALLLAYCAGSGKGLAGLVRTRLIRVPLAVLEGLP